MKTNRQQRMSRRGLWAAGGVWVLGLISVGAQTMLPTSVNYQGKLMNGTQLYNGTATVVFRVFPDADTNAAPVLASTSTVTVVDGVYAAQIGNPDGSTDWSWLAQQPAQGWWLQTAINGTPLSPMERLLSVPYALLADGVKPLGITGGMIAPAAIGPLQIADGSITTQEIGADQVQAGNIADGQVQAAHLDRMGAASGQVLKWNGTAWAAANDLTSGGGALASYAELGAFSPGPQAQGPGTIAQGTGVVAEGDYGTVGGGGYNRLGYAANNSVIGGGYSNRVGEVSAHVVIGGGYGNTVSNSTPKATIGGGFQNRIGPSEAGVIGGGEANAMDRDASYATIGGGRGNHIEAEAIGATLSGGVENGIGVSATNAVVGGGRYNRIGESARYATVAGGYSNAVGASAMAATIGGGYQNSMGNADFSAIVGGAENRVEDLAQYGFIGGGVGHDILTNASYAVIGGGQNNDIGADADWAMIPGGRNNIAAGRYSLAAGRRAQALHEGAFVWADSQDADFASAAADTFLIRAAGGVGVNTAAPRGGLDVAGRTYTRGITIEDEAFVTVTTTSDPLQNGQNLIAACLAASSLMPHGMPRAATNRVAVLVPPGQYNLATNSLVLSADFVDLVGLSSASDHQHLFGDGGAAGVLRQTANDVRIENLHVACLRESGTGRAYNPDGNLPQTVVRNCRFRGEGGGRSMATGRAYAGTYVDCEAGDDSFGSNFDGDAAGLFIRCKGGDFSFGGYHGIASGTFVECEGGGMSFGGDGGTASGTFYRCRGGMFSFGSMAGGQASGWFEQCVGETFSFGGQGGEASGTFIGCVAGDNSYGSRGGKASGLFVDCMGNDSCFGSHLSAEASGVFIRCVGGWGSFGTDGLCSGVFIHCAGASLSFGGNQDGRMTGSLYHCVMTGSDWEGMGVVKGKIAGRMENCTWGAAITIQANARIYGSTVRGAVTGDGSGDCRLAHVRCQSLALGSLVNRIETAYNVIDSDLD